MSDSQNNSFLPKIIQKLLENRVYCKQQLKNEKSLMTPEQLASLKRNDIVHKLILNRLYGHHESTYE